MKVRDENEQIKYKLAQIQILYEQSIKQSILQKKQLLETIFILKKQNGGMFEGQNNIQIFLQEIVEKIAQFQQQITLQNQEQQLKESERNLKQEIDSIDFSTHKNSNNIQTRLRQLKKKIENILTISLDNYQNFQEMVKQNYQREEMWLEKQSGRSEEIATLQISLQKLVQLQNSLKIDNQKIVQENYELQAQLKTYKNMAIQARNSLIQNKNQVSESRYSCSSSSNKCLQQDASFTLDLLSYEKQLLIRTFELIEKNFHDQDIELCLKKIFLAYQGVTNSYRQKLQIQFDLQDLECEYRKQQEKIKKNNINNQHNESLIELKKEINRFRKELHSQKEDLCRKEDILQEKIKDLSGQAINDHRLKSYTIDLQSKLRKQNKKELGNERIRTEEDKEKQIQNKITMIPFYFKQTVNADKMMKDVIQKDRQNMKKILKQTRLKFQKRY